MLTAPAQVQVNGKRVRSKLLIAAVRGILSLQIEPRSESVGAGEVLGYTLTVRNNSFDTVSDVVVTDIVPARNSGW